MSRGSTVQGVEFEDRQVTATPEGVHLDVVIAGLGSRFCAYLIDFAIQVVLFLIALWIAYNLAFTKGTTSELLAEGAFVLFIILDFIGYFVIFELLWGGRSPGKKLTGLRVVRPGGQAVSAWGSLLRNVLRIVDFLPSLYFVGLVSILTSTRNQRLGDMVGGTMVIRDRVAASSLMSGQAFASGAGFAAPAWGPAYARPMGPAAVYLPPELWHWDVSAVPPQELALVQTFLGNRSGYTAEARRTLAADLANRIWPFVSGPGAPPPPEAFLEMVMHVKAARG